MSLDVAKVEIEYLKKEIEELRLDVRALTKQISSQNDKLLELQLGRRWLWGLLSAAAIMGALIDTLMKFFKVY